MVNQLVKQTVNPGEQQGTIISFVSLWEHGSPWLLRNNSESKAFANQMLLRKWSSHQKTLAKVLAQWASPAALASTATKPPWWV